MTQNRQMPIGKPTDAARRLGRIDKSHDSAMPPRAGSKKRAQALPEIYEFVLIHAFALQHPPGQRNAMPSLRAGTPTISSTAYHDTVRRWLLHGRGGTVLKAAQVRKRSTTSDNSARGSA
jgi:hypothetical protein